MTIPLMFRAAHLHLFVDLFHQVGIPVERALARSKLPGSIAETPDAYVSLPLGLSWMARTGRDLAPMELGFFASRNFSIRALSARVRAYLFSAGSGLERIERALRLAALEDSALTAAIRREDERLRLIIDMPRIARHPHACLVEWVNIQALIAIVRSVAGEAWLPSEITFVCRRPIPTVALEAFDTASTRVGQPCTSIVVDAATLAGPCPAPAFPAPVCGEGFEDTMGEGWSLPAALRSVIQPYLTDHGMSVAWAAEMAGLSPRTLQRRLRQSGTSYSELVQQARFELAHRWLSDAALPVGEVAAMAGYENPQHFSRAFRKRTGLSPAAYRTQNQASWATPSSKP